MWCIGTMHLPKAIGPLHKARSITKSCIAVEPAQGYGVFAPIIYPKTNSLTQGVIFLGGLAENYNDCQTYGLILTARCDVANDKIQTYNYLPVVPLDRWLHYDGQLILAGRLAADAYGKMKSYLKHINQSTSILETETPRRVLEILFQSSEKNIAKTRQSFISACEQYELADVAGSGAPNDGHCISLQKTAPHIAAGLLCELVQQRLSGYYFLPQIDPDGSDEGFVVILREIRHIPRHLAEAICHGISTKEYDQMVISDASLAGRLRIMVDEMAMPISMLQSPNIEHLMQCFSMLFGRIGIADIPRDYIDNLWQRQPSVRNLSK